MPRLFICGPFSGSRAFSCAFASVTAGRRRRPSPGASAGSGTEEFPEEDAPEEAEAEATGRRGPRGHLVGVRGGAATRARARCGRGKARVRSRSEGTSRCASAAWKTEQKASGVKPKAGGRDGLERGVTPGARGSGARCATSFGASRCAARREGATRLWCLSGVPSFHLRCSTFEYGTTKMCWRPVARVDRAPGAHGGRARRPPPTEAVFWLMPSTLFRLSPRRPPRASAVARLLRVARRLQRPRAPYARVSSSRPRARLPRRERRPFPGISSGGRHVQRLRQLQQGGQQRRRRAQPPAHRRRRGTPPRVRVPRRRPGGRLRHGSARRPPRPLLPALTFQPTDLDDSAFDAVAHHTANLTNVRPPVVLDATREWDPAALALADDASVAAVLAVNLTHISPWAATQGLARGAGKLLRPGGWLLVYGPFKRDGAHTPEERGARPIAPRGGSGVGIQGRRGGGGVGRGRGPSRGGHRGDARQ